MQSRYLDIVLFKLYMHRPRVAQDASVVTSFRRGVFGGAARRDQYWYQSRALRGERQSTKSGIVYDAGRSSTGNPRLEFERER